jgi:mRNA-degrading endonuclease RelE of RelBE toxin-antitoxin system
LRSRTTRRFRKAFSRLPKPVQERAREAYRRFVENPDHPGLRFKQVHPTEPIYSVRIGRNYRALGVREDDAMIWFWIGSHADYDDLISRM